MPNEGYAFLLDNSKILSDSRSSCLAKFIIYFIQVAVPRWTAILGQPVEESGRALDYLQRCKD